MGSDLTASELAVIEQLPAPPPTAEIRATNIWIIEWLPQGDRQTGKELYEWTKIQRQGWAKYFSCQCKEELFAAIEAAHCVNDRHFSPVLHIEAHGCEDGLEGPNAGGEMEFLPWPELTPHLQKLNLVTGCNLVLVVAACVGFSAVKALVRGPRAPVVAIVGPDANANSSELLLATKEFYRRWQDGCPLTQIAESASREMVNIAFDVEPFALMAYEALVFLLVKSLRESERQAQQDRLRKRLQEGTNLSAAEVDARVQGFPRILPWQDIQEMWDQMFMMDKFPENHERFGVDWENVTRILTEITSD